MPDQDGPKPNRLRGDPLDHVEALLKGQGGVTLFMRAAELAIDELARHKSRSDQHLKPSDVGVMRALVRHARRDTWRSWPSQTTIAGLAGLTTRRHVDLAVKRLQDLGLIQRDGYRSVESKRVVCWRIDFAKLLRAGAMARALAFADALQRSPGAPSPEAQLPLPPSSVAFVEPEMPALFLSQEEDAEVIFDRPSSDQNDNLVRSFVHAGVIFDRGSSDLLSPLKGSKITQSPRGDGNQRIEQVGRTTTWGSEPEIEPTSPVVPSASGGDMREERLLPEDAWQRVRRALRDRITPQNYDTWLRPTRAGFWDLDNPRVLVVIAPNDLAADWLQTRLRSVTQQCAAAALGEGYSVRYIDAA